MEKNPPAIAGDARDRGSVPGLGRSPGEGKAYPLQFLPGEFHGQWSLVGYSPRGGRELNRNSFQHRRCSPDFKSSPICIADAIGVIVYCVSGRGVPPLVSNSPSLTA